VGLAGGLYRTSDEGSPEGEDAIAEQEDTLRVLSAAEIEQQMPAFKACFDRIRSF
tara:strand:- start:236 stop:400 length:165 start_codon:yes stop_codon:yes gene_type:complete